MLVTSVTSYLHAASDQSSTSLIHRFYCQSDSDNQGWEGYFENVFRYSYLWHLKKNKNKKPPLLHMKIKTRESKYRWDDFHLNSNECVFCMNFCILITQSHYMYSVTPQAWGILLTLLALLIHKWNTHFQVFITKQKICFIVALWSTYYGLYERLHIYLLGTDERWCVDRIQKKKKKNQRGPFFCDGGHFQYISSEECVMWSCHRVAPHQEMTSGLRLSLRETMVTHSLGLTQAALPSSSPKHDDNFLICSMQHPAKRNDSDHRDYTKI